MFQTASYIGDFKDALLFLEINAHVRGNGIGKPAGVVDSRENEVSTSEGTFLLSPTYFSNCSTVSVTSEADSFLLKESVSI